MKRSDEIIEAVKKFFEKFECETDPDTMVFFGESFALGVAWADKNPNLESIWHDASEEPEETSKIVIVDTKGEWWNIDYVSDDFDGCGLYGWEFCKALYNLKIWAYISDLLPKGGEK